MKFINFVKYRDLDRIAGARPAHFAYADRLRAQGELAIKANRSADQGGDKNMQIRLFANYAKYGADKSRLATVRPAHWEYDRTLKSAGKLALAGPFANDEGGLFVYNAVRREEALSYLKQDPFAAEGVIADYELLEWLIEGVNPDLLASDFSSESESAAPMVKANHNTKSKNTEKQT